MQINLYLMSVLIMGAVLIKKHFPYGLGFAPSPRKITSAVDERL
jgi:hypothetical protein